MPTRSSPPLGSRALASLARALTSTRARRAATSWLRSAEHPWMTCNGQVAHRCTRTGDRSAPGHHQTQGRRRGMPAGSVRSHPRIGTQMRVSGVRVARFNPRLRSDQPAAPLHSTGHACVAALCLRRAVPAPRARLSHAAIPQRPPAASPSPSPSPTTARTSSLPSALASGTGTALPTCRCLLCTLP